MYINRQSSNSSISNDETPTKTQPTNQYCTRLWEMDIGTINHLVKDCTGSIYQCSCGF